MTIMRLPQTAPISDLRKRQDEVLAMADDGPVILMSRSEPTAVVLSPDKWNELADQLERLEALATHYQMKCHFLSNPSSFKTLGEVLGAKISS